MNKLNSSDNTLKALDNPLDIKFKTPCISESKLEKDHHNLLEKYKDINIDKINIKEMDKNWIIQFLNELISEVLILDQSDLDVSDNSLILKNIRGMITKQIELVNKSIINVIENSTPNQRINIIEDYVSIINKLKNKEELLEIIKKAETLLILPLSWEFINIEWWKMFFEELLPIISEESKNQNEDTKNYIANILFRNIEIYLLNILSNSKTESNQKIKQISEIFHNELDNIYFMELRVLIISFFENLFNSSYLDSAELLSSNNKLIKYSYIKWHKDIEDIIISFEEDIIIPWFMSTLTFVERLLQEKNISSETTIKYIKILEDIYQNRKNRTNNKKYEHKFQLYYDFLDNNKDKISLLSQINIKEEQEEVKSKSIPEKIPKLSIEEYIKKNNEKNIKTKIYKIYEINDLLEIYEKSENKNLINKLKIDLKWIKRYIQEWAWAKQILILLERNKWLINEKLVLLLLESYNNYSFKIIVNNSLFEISKKNIITFINNSRDLNKITFLLKSNPNIFNQEEKKDILLKLLQYSNSDYIGVVNILWMSFFSNTEFQFLKSWELNKTDIKIYLITAIKAKNPQDNNDNTKRHLIQNINIFKELESKLDDYSIWVNEDWTQIWIINQKNPREFIKVEINL